MQTEGLNILMLLIWSVGILGMNIYLSYILTRKRGTLKESATHLLADVLISATAGLITYFLAKITVLPEVYLIMLAAVVGHLASRVAFKSLFFDYSVWTTSSRSKKNRRITEASNNTTTEFVDIQLETNDD